MRNPNEITKRVAELQEALALADFYALTLRDPIRGEIIDDQTIQCAIACVRNECYFSGCIVYSSCQMKGQKVS